jgi:hypothetical protein
MSELNDDKPATQKRKDPLKGVEAGLRDQIPEKLAAKLDDMGVGEKVVNLWESACRNRQEWMDRQEAFLSDWDEFLESTAEGPFQGASSLHIPMPLQVAKTMHARYIQAILGVEPFFNLKPRREDAIDRASLVADLMHYCLKDWCNYNRGIEEAVDLWLWDWITIGSGILKARWECQYERFVDVVQEQSVRFKTIINPQDQTEIQIPEPYIREVEKRITKKTFEGPLVDRKNVEDVVIIGGEGDPQRADAVIERDYTTASELWTLVDRRIFREEQTREAISKGPSMVMGSTDSKLKQRRMENNGKAMLDTDSDLDRYEVLEAYLRMDVDGSGINSDIVVWVHKNTRLILRATYLRRINKAGERPFFKIDFHKRAGQDYGIGIIEMVHPLSKEMDAIHNLRIDYGMISTMPFGFYRPTSSIDPQIIELEPGALIPVDDPQHDVYFPNLGNRTAFGFQEEAALQTMVERLTGVNDMLLGNLTGAQGATRTATGARALLGESNVNLNVALRRLGRGWRQTLQYLLHMLQQRIPKGLSFRVTGESGDDYWSYISSQADIEGDFDFEVSNNSENSNRAIQQEMSQQVLQLVLNPLLIQTGIVVPGNIFEAVKSYLKAQGVKDFSKYVTKPPDWKHNMTPEDEANRLLRNMPVPVTPEMDHAGFIAYWEEIHASDELLGQFNEQQTIALAHQAQQHKQMMAALDQMAKQQNVQDQMRSNAAQSSNQAPPAMNPMATGQAPTGGPPPGGGGAPPTA